jgi:hypothetical protein
VSLMTTVTVSLAIININDIINDSMIINPGTLHRHAFGMKDCRPPR